MELACQTNQQEQNQIIKQTYHEIKKLVYVYEKLKVENGKNSHILSEDILDFDINMENIEFM